MRKFSEFEQSFSRLLLAGKGVESVAWVRMWLQFKRMYFDRLCADLRSRSCRRIHKKLLFVFGDGNDDVMSFLRSHHCKSRTKEKLLGIWNFGQKTHGSFGVMFFIRVRLLSFVFLFLRNCRNVQLTTWFSALHP